MIKVRDALPRDWVDFLGSGMIGVGGDLGTTDKESSNPSCIVVTQHQPAESLYYERLIFRFKTAEFQVSLAVFRMIIDDIIASGRRPRALSLDASNNEFFAQMVQRDLSGKCPTNLVKGGENVNFRGVVGLAKPVLGNLYTAAYEDNFIAIPRAEWVAKDRRLVKREKGSFRADVSEEGWHGDSFDGGKLAYWSLCGGGGNVEAMACGPGVGLSAGMSDDERSKRPLAHLFEAVVNFFS